jgi:hypothetical protein
MIEFFPGCRRGAQRIARGGFGPKKKVLLASPIPSAPGAVRRPLDPAGSWYRPQIRLYHRAKAKWVAISSMKASGRRVGTPNQSGRSPMRLSLEHLKTMDHYDARGGNSSRANEDTAAQHDPRSAWTFNKTYFSAGIQGRAEGYYRLYGGAHVSEIRQARNMG